ncbi:MAG: hypothetical protein QNK37_29755 [Acidobacteriota bacterium]|nr:hypothetical protein [Acidobacteriota bacterium]
MNDTNRQMVNEETAKRGVLDHLRSTLQECIDPKFEIEAIVDLTALMTEVQLKDKAAGARFHARIYRLGKNDGPMIRELWEKHGDRLKSMAGTFPLRIHGVQKLGDCFAHVAAAPTGMDLNTYLRQVGTCKPEFALRVCTNLVMQLEAPAAKGCRHLQIKPTDVVLTREGGVLLKNIGLAPFETELAQNLGLFELTNAAYTAPEQFNVEAELGEQTDIYRLALLLYRMVAGRLPFTGDYEAVKKGHLEAPMPNPQAFNKQVGVGMARVLMMALAKDPAQRFKSLADFKSALALLHPASERAVLAGAPPRPLSEHDLAKIEEQLTEAKELCANKEFETALRTVDSALVMSGPHEGAIRLHNQITEIMHASAVQRSLKEAGACLEKRRVAGTLAALNAVLALQPKHQQALKMQSRIFDGVKQRLLDHQPALPVDLVLGKAAEAKADGNIMPAEGLWTMVMLVPAGDDKDETKKKLKFGKQLAARGLKGMHSLSQSVPPQSGVTEAPPPPPAPSEPKLATPPPPPESRLETPPSPPAPDPASLDPLQRAMLEAEKKQAPEPPPTTDPAADMLKEEGIFDEPPKSETPSSPSIEELESRLSQEENFFDEPAEGQPVAVSKSKAKKPIPKKVLAIAGAVVLVLLVAVVFIAVRAQQQKKYRAAAVAAFEQVVSLENSGDWDGALAQWASVRDDFPGFEYGPEKDTAEARIAGLQRKIAQRKQDIADQISRATAYVDQDLLVGDTEMNALYSINRVRALEPENPDLTALLDRIRTEQSAAANALVDENKILEGQEVYNRLRLIDSEFRDEDLEERMREWLLEKVVNPQMAKLERAVKRKRWDEALKISEDLRPKMPNTSALDQYWDNVMVDYQTLYDQAMAANQETKMLQALEVMARIRPDDQELVAKKDRLSRDINLTKITNLENRVQREMKAKQYFKAATSAKRLLKIESNNKIAAKAMEEIRFRKKEEIKKVENNDPRKALALYEELLRISNWKSYRKERDVIKERITAFDKQVNTLQGLKKNPLDQQKKAVDKILVDFPIFINDSKFKQLTDTSSKLGEEHTRISEVLRWEARVADDPGKPYAEILDRLKKERNYAFNYSKTRISALVKKYSDKIEKYDGTVRLVIKTGRDLPKIKARKMRGFVTLETGGQTYKTGEDLLTAPNWNYITNFQAEPGAKLVFKVYQIMKRKQEKLLGTIELPKVPLSGKDMVLKPSNGKWSLVVDVQRER